jgi:hypothetical protein
VTSLLEIRLWFVQDPSCTLVPTCPSVAGYLTLLLKSLPPRCTVTLSPSHHPIPTAVLMSWNTGMPFLNYRHNINTHTRNSRHTSNIIRTSTEVYLDPTIKIQALHFSPHPEPQPSKEAPTPDEPTFLADLLLGFHKSAKPATPKQSTLTLRKQETYLF